MFDHTAPPPGYVLRLRSVGAPLAINVVAGVWLHLNVPEAIPKFSFGSFVVAIPTVLGLLPTEEKAGWTRGVMSRVHRWLGRPGTAAGLTWTALLLAVAGTLCSSVRVDADRGATAQIRVVDGTQAHPVMLINGETRFHAMAAVGEVVRLYLVNTANTRIFNVAVARARMKLIGGDSGR